MAETPNPNIDFKALLDTLRTQIGISSASTKEQAAHFRELSTLLIAFNEGLISSNEALEKLAEDIANNKFTTKTIKKTFKDLQYTEDTVNQIYKIRVKSDELLDEEIIKINKIEDVYKRIYELSKNTDKIQTETTTLYDALNKSIQDRIKLLKTSGAVDASNVERLTSNINSLKTAASLFDFQFIDVEDIHRGYDEIKNVLNNIDGTTVEIDGQIRNKADVIAEYNSLAESQEKNIEEEFALRQSKLKAYIAQSKGLSMVAGEEGPELYNKKTRQKLEGPELSASLGEIESITKRYEEFISLMRQGKKLTEEQLRGLTAMDRVIISQAASQDRLLSKLQGELLSHKRISVVIEKQQQALKQLYPYINAASSASETFVGKLQGAADVLPGFIKNILGIDKGIEKISGAGTEAIEKFKTSILSGKSVAESMRGAFSGWGGAIKGAIGPVGAVALILAGMYSVASMAAAKYSEISADMGITKEAAKSLYESNAKFLRSTKNQVVLSSELLEVQKQLVHSTGQTAMLRTQEGQKTAAYLANVASVTGQSTENTVELYEAYSKLGADSSLSKQLLMSTAAMSEMSGIAPSIITRDLIENADMLSTYFSGLPEEAMKAAVEARKMGMSLSSVGKVIDQALNFESFMTNMYELKAMTGGGIDLSKVFDASISGDVNAVSKELMNALGSMENFNKLQPLEKKKLAETLGLSVDEISKSLMLQEKMKNMSAEERKIIEENVELFKDKANMSSEELAKYAASIEPTKRLNKVMEDIKGAFIKAVLPLAESFSKVIANVGPMLTGISATFGVIGSALSWVFSLVGGVVELLSKGAAAVGRLFNWFSDSKSDVDSTGKSIAGITSSAEILGNAIGVLLGGFMAFKVVPSIFGKIKSGFGSIIDTAKSVKDFGKKGVELVTGAAKKLSGTGSGNVTEMVTEKINKNTVIDTVKTKSEKLKDIAMSRPRNAKGQFVKSAPAATGSLTKMDGSVGELQSKGKTAAMKLKDGFTSFGEVAKSAINSVSTIIQSGMKLIGDAVKSGMDIVSGILTKTASTLSSILQSIGTGIGTFVEKVIGGLGKGLSAFKPQALIGAAGLVIVAGALFITAKAMQEFTSVDWSTVAMAGASLAGLGLIAAGFGTLAPFISAGALAMAAASAGLWVFGKALGGVSEAASIAQPVIQTFLDGIAGIAGTVFNGVNTLLSTLSGVNVVSLGLIGPALISVAAGLAALAGGSIVSSIVEFFAGNPFEPLLLLADMANPLALVADSLLAIRDSLSAIGDVVSKVDVSQLKEIVEGVASTNIQTSTPLNVPRMAVASTPSATATAQNVSISESAAVPGKKPVRSKEQIIEEDYYGSTQGGSMDVKSIGLYLQQMVKLMQEMNNRPVVVQFSDGVIKELNSRTKYYTNKG